MNRSTPEISKIADVILHPGALDVIVDGLEDEARAITILGHKDENGCYRMDGIGEAIGLAVRSRVMTPDDELIDTFVRTYESGILIMVNTDEGELSIHIVRNGTSTPARALMTE